MDLVASRLGFLRNALAMISFTEGDHGDFVFYVELNQLSKFDSKTDTARSTRKLTIFKLF